MSLNIVDYQDSHYIWHWKKLTLISMVSIAIIILGYALRYIVNLILARYLQAAIYGDWAFIFNVITFSSIIVLLGADDATLVFVPEYVISQSWNKVAGFLRRHIKLIIFMSFLIIAGGGILVSILYLLDRIEYINISDYYSIIFSFWLIPLAGIVMFNAKLLRILHNLTWSLVTYKILVFLLFGLGVLLIIAITDGLNIHQVLMVYGVALLLVAVIQTASIKSIMPHEVLVASPIYLNRYWFKVSSRLMISGLIFTGISSLDLIMLEILGPHEAEVGIFAAVLTICAAILLINITVNVVISPFINVIVRRQDKGKLQAFVNNSSLILTIPTIILVSVIILLGKMILGQFGPKFVAGYQVLIMVAIGYAVAVCFGVSLALLRYTEHQDTVVKANFAGLIVMILIEIILVPKYGMYGAAIGLVTSRIFMAIWFLVMVKKCLGVSAFFSLKLKI